MKKYFQSNAIKFLGLNNNSFLSMVVMVIIIGLGEKMAERFLPLYLLALGGTAASVASLNGLTNLLGALYSFPGGYISDKFGYKNALKIFTIIALFGYLIVIVIPKWQAVLVGSLFFIAWSAISLPAVMSLISKVMEKEKRTMGVSMHSLVRRIPMALGPLFGGVMIKFYGNVKGIKYSFIIAFILGLFSLLCIHYFMEDDKSKRKTPLPLKDVFKNFSASLRNLLISDILIRFAEQIPYAFVVIWVVKNNGLTALQFGWLTAIEMTTAVLIYVPVAYFADKYTKKPFVVITFIFFTIFPLILFFSKTFIAFVFAFIIRGLKEFGEPTRKALIMDLAPENAKAATFGTYYLIRDTIVSIAAFSSAFLWNISPKTNFMTAFIFGIIGTLLFAIFGKDLKKTEI